VEVSIAQPVQPLSMMNGRRLFTQSPQSNLSSIVDYEDLTTPGRPTIKLRPLPSREGATTETPRPATTGDAKNIEAWSVPEDDSDDERMNAVMNAIRPIHPAYCMTPACEEATDCDIAVDH